MQTAHSSLIRCHTKEKPGGIHRLLFCSPLYLQQKIQSAKPHFGSFLLFTLHADHSTHEAGSDSVHQHKATDYAAEQDTQREHPEGAGQVVMLWEEP